MHCPLSASLRRAYPLSTAINPATGVLQALHLSPTLSSLFYRYRFGYRGFDHSLPLPDALCHPLMRISPFHRYPFGCGYFDRYLPLSDAHPPLPPLSIRLQECCMLSTSLGRAYPLSVTAVLRQPQSLGLGDFLCYTLRVTHILTCGSGPPAPRPPSLKDWPSAYGPTTGSSHILTRTTDTPTVDRPEGSGTTASVSCQSSIDRGDDPSTQEYARASNKQEPKQ